MAKLFVSAVGEDTIAAPGNAQRTYVIVSVEDSTGNPVTGMTVANFQLGTEIGLLFTLKSTAKYQLQIGPVAHYNFTNLTKSVVYSNQHLLFTGIKTSFSFK